MTRFFQGPVNIGEIFNVGSSTGAPLDDTLLITIASFTGIIGIAGRTLQTGTFSAKCTSSSDVSLLTRYGALELASFHNAQLGYQSAIEAIEQSYTIGNIGEVTANIEWANLTSTLFGSFPLISPPGLPIRRHMDVSFPYVSSTLNLYAARGQTFNSTLDVSGVGQVSGLSCTAAASISFTMRG